jgi:hypothetical protein
LPRGKLADCGVKEEHSAWTNASKAKLTPHACDCAAEVGEQVSGLSRNGRYVKRSFITGRAHLLINDGSLIEATTRTLISAVICNNQRATCVLKKIQLDAIDLAIHLRCWNMIILMLGVEVATAKTSHSSDHL